MSFGYDAADQLRTLTDPRGKTWTYDYDALGIRTSVTDPLGRERTWSFDAAGELTSRTDARGIQTAYGYDATGRLVSETFPGGGITHAWDAAGQRTGMTDPTGQSSTTTYDAAGRVTSVDTPRGEITYTYDAAGRRATMTLPGNRTVTYDYDARGLDPPSFPRFGVSIKPRRFSASCSRPAAPGRLHHTRGHDQRPPARGLGPCGARALEGDLIIGLNRSAIGTLVERTTRFTMLLHLPRLDGYGTQPRVRNGPALAGYGAEAVRVPPITCEARAIGNPYETEPGVPPI